MKEESKWTFNGIEVTEAELKYWQSEVRLGKDFRKKHYYDSENASGKAVDCINYYLGKQAILDEGLETPIVDNQIAPIVNSFTAALLFQNPEVIIKEKRVPSAPYQSQISKAVFDYFQSELKMEWHNQQALFDAFITGIGVKTNGYNSEFDYIDEKEKVYKTVKRRKGLGRGKGWKEVEEQVEQEIVRRKEWITREFPFNVRHSPLMTVVDPRAKNAFPYDGKWIDLEFEVPYNEVKGNSMFENTDDLAPTGAVGTDKDKIIYDDYKKGMCHIHQIQISRKDGLYVLTMAEDYNKPLRYVKFPFEIEGFLTTFLTLNDTVDSFYPPSDIERLLPLQDEVNYIQSKILEAIYKFLPKIGINSDFFKDETEITNAIAKGDIGTILVSRGQATPQQAVQVLNFTLNLQDKIAVLQMLKNEIRLISGVTEAELTGSTDARTATEANIGARGFSARIIAKREKLRRFIKEDLRKFKQIVQQAADFELVVKITGLNEIDPQTGENVNETWVKLNRVKDYVLGEYELDIDIESAAQPNLELKRRQILESANFLFSPMLQQQLSMEGNKIDYTLLAKEFLRTMNQFREATNLVKPLSQQEKQELAAQEILKTGALQKMATAPQGPQDLSQMQGEPQSAGELTASVLGAGV